mgnify:CR=1 FL=1
MLWGVASLEVGSLWLPLGVQAGGTPASRHSSNIYCKFGLPLIGISSFGIMLVRGSILVPKPANGIMACFII